MSKHHSSSLTVHKKAFYPPGLLVLLVFLLFVGQFQALAAPVGAVAEHGHGRAGAKAGAPQRRPTAADWRAGRLLVRLASGTNLALDGDGVGPICAASPALWAALAGLGLGQAEALDKDSGLYRLYASGAGFDVGAAVRALAALPGVAYAEPDFELRASFAPNDPYYSQQWYLNKIAVPAAWDVTTGSRSVIVAMADTGISPVHPDLTGQLVAGYNFVSDNTNTSDDNGHGTYTAGLVAALRNNGVGIAGVAPGVRLMPIKILDKNGGGSVGDFVRGLHWATDHGARVINVSAGIEYPVTAMLDAVRYARNHGVLVVASAGNSPDGNPQWPAGYAEVVAVSATDEQDRIASFSSYGSFVDLSAPGTNMISDGWSPGRIGYESASGTSSSAPLVSAAAALLLSVKPALSPTELQRLLEDGSDDLGRPGWDPYFGAGRLNIAHSLLLAGAVPPTQVARTPTPAPPTPTPAPPAAALAVNPVHTLPGGTVSLTGHGFAPGEAVALRLVDAGGRSHDLAGSQADLHGGFTASVVIPAGLGPGLAGISARGAKSGSLGTSQIILDTPPPPNVPTPTPVPDEGGRITLGGQPLVPLADPASAFAPVGDPARAGVIYFPRVQHSLSGIFLNYWQSHGGLPIFGYPISEEFAEVSTTDGLPYNVQYFQRNRFEYHPEKAGTPYEVLLGLLGRDVTSGRSFDTAFVQVSDATHLYFPLTGHLLGGSFLVYWQAHGGLPIFGYPISEEFQENGYTVQYFERNRFEYHPENAGTPNDVLLGLLGADVARALGFMSH
ncbi:MAG: S8 family serine peptidase [Chloroflexia bacterium]